MANAIEQVLDDNVAIPRSLIQEEPVRAIEGTTVPVRIKSDVSAPSVKNQNTFRIDIPNGQSSFWVAKNSFLCFELTPTQGVAYGSTATRNKLSNYVHSMFESVRFMNGSTELQRIDNYGLYASMILTGNYESDYIDTVGKGTFGAGSDDDRSANHDTGAAYKSRRYCMPLLLDSLKHTYPLFTTQSYSLEFRLVSDINRVLEVDTDAATVVANYWTDIKLSNITLSSHFLNVESRVDRGLRLRFKDRRVMYQYEGFDYYTLQVEGVDNDVVISSKKSTMSGLMAIVCNPTTFTDPEVEGKLDNSWTFSGMTEYSANINGLNYPNDQIETKDGTELYVELLRFFSLLDSNTGNSQITVENMIANKALMCLDTRTFEDNDGIISGINTAGSIGSLRFKMRHSNALASGSALYVFVRHNGLVVIDNGAVFKVD